MAARLKAGKGKQKGKSTKGRKLDGLNTLSPEEAAEAFEELFKLHAKLASVSGEIRKDIADEYATVAKRMDIPKKIVKHLFGLEKHRRDVVKKQAEFDSRDRDALMKVAQMMGEDTPFGQFAMRAADLAKRDDFGGAEPGDAGEGGEDEGEEAEG